MCFSFFFFKQKTAYEMRISDWSSDVCSSDLILVAQPAADPLEIGVDRARDFALVKGVAPAFGDQAESAREVGVAEHLSCGRTLAVVQPIGAERIIRFLDPAARDRKSTRLNSSH